MGDGDTRRKVRDRTRLYAGRLACWNHGLESSENREINVKMYSVFLRAKSFPYKRIIFQFWRPIATDDGRLVLQCIGNAFAVSSYVRPLRDKYRTRCVKYQYGVDDEGDNPPWIISSGCPVPTAFLNHFPEVVPDLRVHAGSPLVDCALECDLTCCVMLPLFYRHSSQCVGVVECSMQHPADLLPIFNELKRELEEKGLAVYHVQGSWPYKAIPGDLEPVKIETEKGLKIACESHDLILGQVWIPHQPESDNHAPRFLVKLNGYSADSDDDRLSAIKDFYNNCDVISLKTGEGLAGKTLQTCQPHLCRNIFKLRGNKGVLALLSANTQCASLVLCLRSTHTRELDYVFEFFWPCSRNHLILSETLLLTLSKYLTSFKFNSGEQIDDEIFFVDVSGSPIQLNEARTSAGVKRKSIAGQSDSSQSKTNNNNPEGDADDDLAILATYRNEVSLIHLPSSYTSENVLEKLHKEFELDPARNYKVEYQVCPRQWSAMVCLASCRRRDDMGLILLRVVADGREVGWRWRTNS